MAKPQWQTGRAFIGRLRPARAPRGHGRLLVHRSLVFGSWSFAQRTSAMKWKTTWLLLGLGALLFAFIVLVERRLPDANVPPSRLLSFRASEVTNIQLRL